ncbi:hypothetical protein [Celeribacter sp.]|uniref:hypothetical protein n=1 Tax=Celeribacter sp. TaxID=1890673 RepID=UPI003A8DCDE0
MKLDVIEGGDWLDQYLATGELPDVPVAPTWTPDFVGEQLVEALKWAKHNAGRVGPGGMVGSYSPFVATFDDHLAEGWGLPEIAGDDEPDERRRHAALQLRDRGLSLISQALDRAGLPVEV